MQVPAGIRTDERILILGIPEPAAVVELARAASEGLVVAIGGDDAVREARRHAREFDNVMFVPGSPEELPWGDGFFNRVIDLVGSWPEPERVECEIARVTSRERSSEGG